MRASFLGLALVLFCVVACSSSSSGGNGGSGSGGCRTQSDCTRDGGFEICVPPGGSAGCGVDGGTHCHVDGDCASKGATYICASTGCAVDCVPGCTDDTQCGAGESCAPTHHCVAKSCSGVADCPANFSCDGVQCVRRSCTDDSACDAGGACVNGRCYDTAGTCREPAA